MPFLDGYEIINYALDAEYEEKIFWRWAIGYQFVMGFEEFKRNLDKNRPTTDNRTAAEILDEVKDIIG